MSVKTPLGITEVVLRDAHQSLFATRMRIDDMLPIAEKLDEIGFWSIESWGGATFDACIRFLGEDPWDRIRQLKKAMPKTPQQMLFRGQNILGYRHYADDIVDKFVDNLAGARFALFVHCGSVQRHAAPRQLATLRVDLRQSRSQCASRPAWH